ncbi:hypothetical protein [Motilibacter aurantiacus]|uniref:hypothetical protein n=1 Tax=Motilibacter aurantiacus TaxID=2714955 RepID=UPI001409AE32|nr:hypothetical protein [Motilibacter aurantiacus]NHC47652.1 hypothetical protein [Motilibacter aurantiacus]
MPLPPLPAFLPRPDSAAWHRRRWQDNLGYFRARTLTNASYGDVAMLLNHLVADREEAARRGQGLERGLYDRAVAAAKAWRREPTSERWWDAVACVDRILEEQERRRRGEAAAD